MRETLAAMTLAMLAPGVVFPRRCAGSAFGTLANFDVVNDTPTPCHCFEIELEDIGEADVQYTFGGEHIRYGTPEVLDIT